MGRLYRKILQFIILGFIILFSMANIQYWNEVIFPMIENDTKPNKWVTFNFMAIRSSDLYSTLTMILLGIAFVSLLLNYLNDVQKSNRRRAQDGKSYAKILSKFKRRRGTVLIKYASKDYEDIKRGDPVEDGIIKSWYRFKTKFSKHYNKIAKHFYLPATKILNEVKYDENGLEVVEGGLPLMAMRKYFLFGKFDKLWYLTGDQHSLFVGSTGRGKTFTYVLPMIYSYIRAGESIVVHDPKREIDAFTRKALNDNGYNIIVIDFVDPKNSDGWNPLDIAYKEWNKAIDIEFDTWEFEEIKDPYNNKVKKVYKKNIYFPKRIIDGKVVAGGEKEVKIKEEEKYKKGYKYANVSTAVEYVMAVAQALTWEEDAKDPFWHQGAGDMFAGGAIFAMEEGIPDIVNAKTARYLIELGDDVDAKGKPLLKRYIEKYREEDAESTRKFATYLNAEGNVKPSFKSVFMNKVSLLTANDDIMNMTSTSTFDMEKIFKEKTAVFLKTHDERSTYYPLVVLFLKQLYEVGIKVTRERPSEQRLDVPMNWVIDEMGLLPEIKDIEAIYGAARSRGIRINAFIQSFEQLEDKYEDKVASIIEDNSTNVIYLGSQAENTRKRFSDLAGQEEYYDRMRKEYRTRPVITPEKLKSFEKGRSLVNTIEWNPFISKLPPYDAYAFFDPADWKVKEVVKPPVKHFNIRVAWKKREGRRNKVSDQGVESYDMYGSDSKSRGYDKSVNK